MKKVRITQVRQIFTELTEGYEIFNEDKYKMDFKRALQERMKDYLVEFAIVVDEEWTLIPKHFEATNEQELSESIKSYTMYPIIEGEISETEKEEIRNILEEDYFLLFHSNGDYYETIKLDHQYSDSKSRYINNFYNNKIEYIMDGRYDLTNFQERNLKSEELYFLKYITLHKSNPLKEVSQYWSYDKRFDYQDMLNQYVGQGLVDVIELELKEKINYLFNVKQLKEKLREKKLIVGGKKPILIERLFENLTPDEFYELNKKRIVVYKLTEKGFKNVEPINPTLTWDNDLEDYCFDLVINNNIKEAYITIKKYKEEFNRPKDSLVFGFKEERQQLYEHEIEEIEKLKEVLKEKVEINSISTSDEIKVLAAIVVGLMFTTNENLIANFVSKKLDVSVKNMEIYSQITNEI
ncbi:MAG: SAP domain-containing protein, partial [Clostridia bacterium]|nr:SAP domain-containing protein [Clostridia bacterium]